MSDTHDIFALVPTPIQSTLATQLLQHLHQAAAPPAGQLENNSQRAARSRLGLFVEWARTADPDKYPQRLLMPDLAGWRDQLLAEKRATSTVSVYLHTVRAVFHRLLVSNDFRSSLYDLFRDLPLPERQIFVQEYLTRLGNTLSPTHAGVRLTRHQDSRPKHHWLSPEQVSQLLDAPGLKTLFGIRNTGLLALMVTAGLRATEICSLQVEHLRTRLGGELALYVAEGKGQQSRQVPYGSLAYSLVLVDLWLKQAGIEQGPVFCRLRNGVPQPGQGLTTRMVNQIVRHYQVLINSRPCQISSHDLRRTYARTLYLEGITPEALMKNMGHQKWTTTLAYIGPLGVDQRVLRQDPFGLANKTIQRVQRYLDTLENGARLLSAKNSLPEEQN